MVRAGFSRAASMAERSNALQAEQLVCLNTFKVDSCLRQGGKLSVTTCVSLSQIYPEIRFPSLLKQLPTNKPLQSTDDQSIHIFKSEAQKFSESDNN